MELRIAARRPLPEPDPHEVLLLEALARAGVPAHMGPWHDDHRYGRDQLADGQAHLGTPVARP